MLRAVTRWALVLVVLAGCSVPTAVGELQSAVGDGQTSGTTTAATDGVDPGSTTDDGESTTLATSGPASSSSGGSTGEAITPEMTAFVMRWGDVPELDTDSNSEVGTGGGLDPDALLVTVGFTAGRCGDPFAVACGMWDVSFVLDLDQQVPGTYDWSEVNAGFSEAGEGPNPDNCDGYGGGTFDATIVIESIDDTGIQVRFENVDTPVFEPDVDLEGFSTFASRC